VVEAVAVLRRHHLLAVAINEDSGHRNGAAWNAQRARGVDPEFCQTVEESAAGVVGADRAGKSRTAAEAGDGDGGIGGTAAGGQDQVAGAHLAARCGETLDRTEILNRDAGAQHRRRALDVRRSQRRSPPTRG
jgi:hypothetical protein